jgi:chromatin segregation and condensation protein Rec8/ScpA/Scc1 (kleisin family)
VTFLAVLELIRLKQIGVTQQDVFSPIELVKLEVETREYLPDEPTSESS